MPWKKDIINYRREKAAETLEDAKMLFERKRLFSAVNRIYYAMFYEVIALLHTKGLSSSKHTGVRALFNQHFVKTGIVKVEIGKFYSEMFDFRQEGDYDDFIYFEEEKVKNWLGKAEKYIKVLEECIDKQKADSDQPDE
ncbi:MAG: HEPN domain-containing protein [Candidatus Aminicenantes bacterium]|nr:HEPN domain-containing protein [Candidatus Aminicenantes bacterium]NIM85073.1 HEPN domain-containing protein [Candidatus Aminicenantes bacterium]NIN24580.1 HEPN domain-containing protein [Candidatus Aminicenantes bacterium]NIN48344.1 HEPN domain-containing protein [Candidatus Aminicenantes bacterium]NIN91247.1 HEPN domain-containing protein [Candidatus Aminicenantes bacterium]